MPFCRVHRSHCVKTIVPGLNFCILEASCKLAWHKSLACFGWAKRRIASLAGTWLPNRNRVVCIWSYWMQGRKERRRSSAVRNKRNRDSNCERHWRLSLVVLSTLHQQSIHFPCYTAPIATNTASLEIRKCKNVMTMSAVLFVLLHMSASRLLLSQTRFGDSSFHTNGAKVTRHHRKNLSEPHDSWSRVEKI